VTVIGIQTRRVFGPPRAGERGMASYLLMPRPKDLVKGWLLAATYLLGTLGLGHFSVHSILRALVVLAAVELLVYPARYQWNDVRGFVADQSHPSSSGRGRLPGPLSKVRTRVGVSCAVALAKLAITVVLIVLLPGFHLGGVVMFAIAGVFGVAIVYEALRSTSTGQSDAFPPPLRPGIVLLWLVVGGGYVVRGMLGLALAVDLSRQPTLTVVAAVALWCYGTAFVTSRWAIEATAFATACNGRLRWTARADQAREHQVALVRWLPPWVAESHKDIREWSPLQERTAATAPWNVAMIGAGAAAALSGLLLCGSYHGYQCVLVAFVGGLTAAAVEWSAGRRELAVGATTLVLLGTLTILHLPRPVPAALPWVLLMAAYLFFTTRSLRKLERPNAFGHLSDRMGAAAGRLVLGSSTWEAVQTQGQRAEERQAWATARHLS
jgi:hypothetical protein